MSLQHRTRRRAVTQKQKQKSGRRKNGGCGSQEAGRVGLPVREAATGRLRGRGAAEKGRRGGLAAKEGRRGEGPAA